MWCIRCIRLHPTLRRRRGTVGLGGVGPGEECPAAPGQNAMAGLPDTVTETKPRRAEPRGVMRAVSRYLAHGIHGENHERSRNQCLTSIVRNSIGAGASSFSRRAG